MGALRRAEAGDAVHDVRIHREPNPPGTARE